MDIRLNIYDEQGKNVARVAKGEYYDLTVGVIIDVFDFLDMDDNGKIISVWDINLKLLKCYKQITEILHKFFPDITKEEWKRVKLKELAKILLDIVQFTFTEIDEIPIEKN